MTAQPSPQGEAALLRRVADDRLRLLRFLYCDPSGVIRGKQVHAARLAGPVHSGLGLTRAQNAVNVLDDLVPIPDMEPVGEVRIVPDPATYVRLPWLDGVGSVLCDQVGHDGRDWGCCPRAFLRRTVDRAAEAGLRVRASFENEFYLAEPTEQGPVPWGDGPVYSSAGLDRSARVVNDIVDALIEQGLDVEQAINEYGPGQQEISIRYDDALAAADNQLRLRDTVRGVVEGRHGLLASFAPRPFPDAIGSGTHVHFSLWSTDGGANLMPGPADPFAVSEVGRAFLAGVLDHLPALVALTCPSYLSYDRLRPGAWAGSTVSWGYDNREAALRVASPFRGREHDSANAELKACDASSNPHLALGGLVLAGLDGVERGLDLPEPAAHDPAKLTVAQARRSAIRPLPATQADALDHLAADAVLTDGLGDLMTRCILATRRAEYDRCVRMGDDAVRAATFAIF
ncbi:glutamine synthetase family protein [Pseudonocardia acidicola]|uniref:Glutamine synthetase n=1 Tax=Pseudonocardia acidicola TaxID=2724939 RepID=A0ABX1S778_9PSEU|nr:glutamine synthetase family protein [Pseudonocardia acidicola]NMH97418.1 glutamine synthetase [Pseudonocardia acidicola]